VFPISDFSETSLLEYVDSISKSRNTTSRMPAALHDVCRRPLKVTLRLICLRCRSETGAKSVKDIKEQDVYMGDVPFMTNNGTFIVNGTERVIVSQMHRFLPCVFFDHDKGQATVAGSFCLPPASFLIALLARLRIRCKDIVHVRIDRRAKLPATTLLYGLASIRRASSTISTRRSCSARPRMPLDDSRRNRRGAQRKPNQEWTHQTGEVLTEPGQEDHRSAR